MKINKNTVVSLTYQLRLDNAQGEIVETVTTENPFTMLSEQEICWKLSKAILMGKSPEITLNFFLRASRLTVKSSTKRLPNCLSKYLW